MLLPILNILLISQEGIKQRSPEDILGSVVASYQKAVGCQAKGVLKKQGEVIPFTIDLEKPNRLKITLSLENHETQTLSFDGKYLSTYATDGHLITRCSPEQGREMLRWALRDSKVLPMWPLTQMLWGDSPFDQNRTADSLSLSGSGVLYGRPTVQLTAECFTMTPKTTVVINIDTERYLLQRVILKEKQRSADVESENVLEISFSSCIPQPDTKRPKITSRGSLR